MPLLCAHALARLCTGRCQSNQHRGYAKRMMVWSGVLARRPQCVPLPQPDLKARTRTAPLTLSCVRADVQAAVQATATASSGPTLPCSPAPAPAPGRARTGQPKRHHQGSAAPSPVCFPNLFILPAAGCNSQQLCFFLVLQHAAQARIALRSCSHMCRQAQWGPVHAKSEGTGSWGLSR